MGGKIPTGKPKYSEKIFPYPTSPATCFTQTGKRKNPGLRGEGLATNV
jgi:hypothetical protein